MPPAPWIPCEECDDFWCNIHDQHVFECPCPPVEEWETDPYADVDTDLDELAAEDDGA